MPTKVLIPSRFTIGALYPFVQAIVGGDGYPTDTEFTLDFRWLSFVDGSGLTVLTNTIEWLFKLDVKVFFDGHNRTGEAIRYLDSCGFFERYLGAKLNTYANTRSTTIPCASVTHADSFGWLQYNFEPWMASTLSTDPRSLYSLKACVKELFNNIHDHSTEDLGCIHLQHYPKLGTVSITVSDFGRGIPSTIRDRFGAMDDATAITKAMELGITAQTTPQNRGVGLHYLSETVTRSSGQVSIYSFSGAVVCQCAPDGTGTRRAGLGNGSYPGTLVDIMLPIEKFLGDELDEEEELEW